MKKRYFYTSFIILILVASIATFFSFAYFSDQKLLEDEEKIGSLSVNIKPYFIKDDLSKEYIDLVGDNRILYLNISDYADERHLNRFGVELEIKSNIDIYFRIQVIEQFALTYLSGNKETIIAVTREDFVPFNYNLTSFFDNRFIDEYYYYQTRVNNNYVSQTVNFITPLGFEPADLYPIYQTNYKVILGFFIETVQADHGPQENWKLPVPPWSNGSNPVEW